MRRQLHLLASLSLATALTTLTGCMTMGGTVKGKFACQAPEGICAPSSTIDDRALAMIVGAGAQGDQAVTPAGPYVSPRVVEPGFQRTALDATRTGERVLRIVFPAQIDGAGRLHEQTAVHAVVEQGDWRQASADSVVASSREEVTAAVGGETLLAAVERGDPPVTDDAQPDPNVPSPAAVAAARAKGTSTRQVSTDPIGDIKDQVARRVAARPQRVSYSRPVVPAPATQTPAIVPHPATTATPSAPVARPVAPVASGTIIPAHATAAGRAAISAVNANAAVTAGLARAEPEARLASKAMDPLPVLHAAPLPGVDQ